MMRVETPSWNGPQLSPFSPKIKDGSSAKMSDKEQDISIVPDSLDVQPFADSLEAPSSELPQESAMLQTAMETAIDLDTGEAKNVNKESIGLSSNLTDVTDSVSLTITTDYEDQQNYCEVMTEEAMTQSSETLTSVSTDTGHASPFIISSLLRPFSEMSKDELVQMCINLERMLDAKDDDIARINEHFDHCLNVYRDTVKLLAQRDSELRMCQRHLREAQKCLQQWKAELLETQEARNIKSRASVVSDNVILETRARMNALATNCGVATDDLQSQGEDEINGKAKANGDSQMCNDCTLNGETGEVNVDKPAENTMLRRSLTEGNTPGFNLFNPKRVSRRMNQSLDFAGQKRIAPVLHRRKSARVNDSTRPVPTPRQSVNKVNSSFEESNSCESEDVVKTYNQTYCGQSALEREIFGDEPCFSATMPVSMSFDDGNTHVDILKLDTERCSSSSDSDQSEDTVRTENRPPTVIERSDTPEPMEDVQMDTDTNDQTTPPPVLEEHKEPKPWSEAEVARPRTSCGRPLTGERRPQYTGERPPTRSGPITASKSLEDHLSGSEVQNSEGWPQVIENFHKEIQNSQGNLLSKSVTLPAGTKHKRLVFKEIKTSETSKSFMHRPPTPHTRGRRRVSYNGCEKEDETSTDDHDKDSDDSHTNGDGQIMKRDSQKERKQSEAVSACDSNSQTDVN